VELPALRPLDIVVTDTTGSTTQSVAPRKAYLQIAKDRAINASIPLAARTDILTALGNLLAFWQLTRGTITKRLHSDNAKEQISAAVRTYLHAQGTSTTKNSRRCSAQNGAPRMRDSHGYNPRPLIHPCSRPPENLVVVRCSRCQQTRRHTLTCTK
jgi:hypothetical protein